jgi:general secretion pathway protein E
VHTNDAVSSVTRLVDMGVEPFLLSSSLLGVLAQRLVRRLCTQCKRRGEDGEDGQPRWHPVGCSHCSHTGYKGRTGVYELMVATSELQALVHNRAPEQELAVAARQAGLRSMREDGERLVRDGVTSLEEVVRVTRD